MTRKANIACLIAVGAALLATITGCNTESCTENQSSIPLAGFYGSDGAKISVDSLCIRGVGAPSDSALYSGSALSQVYLPLRSDMESTSYCFQYLQKELNHTQLYDTITFRYTSEPYFTSEECGLSFIYTVTDLSFTTHLIDSVKLLDNKITPADVEQLQIYFRTATDSPETPGDNGYTQNPAAHTRCLNPDGHENR